MTRVFMHKPRIFRHNGYWGCARVMDMMGYARLTLDNAGYGQHPKDAFYAWQVMNRPKDLLGRLMDWVSHA